ncbi:MAG: hypothetical protein C4527_23190 [Candidatus Omnitrophota bacterium]|jgi:hypothetical protein|nr:MAG: hypothetical protein C4527_23190 [Candidatus Omnitrophota bacterium]
MRKWNFVVMISMLTCISLNGVVFAQNTEFGPVATNTYIVKFIDPAGPLPEIGGDFDSAWAAALNDGTNWLIYTDPENDQDPINGPRSDQMHFYAGIVDGNPPRLYVGIMGNGFTPGIVADAPTENDMTGWWGSALYEFLILQNYPEDPRNKIVFGADGHYADFLRNPNVTPAEHNLENLEFNVIPGGDFYAVEFAFDIDENTAFITLDDPDESGITWLRVIVSIQGEGAPLIVWPDGDFNGNVNYLTHGSTGWDHMGWWDVTTARNTPIRFEGGTDIMRWSIF